MKTNAQLDIKKTVRKQGTTVKFRKHLPANKIQFLRKYADEQNARLRNSTAVFLTTAERIAEYEKQDPNARDLRSNAMKKHTEKYSTKWEDIVSNRPRLGKTTLDKIRIDDSMNRQVAWKHLCNITENFSAPYAMPLMVYEDPDAPGCYIAYDGQHTSLAILTMAEMFKKKPEEVEVDIIISPYKLRSDVRQHYETYNSTGRKPLDELDLMHSRYHSVSDGLQNRTQDYRDYANVTKAKIDALAAVGIFLTKKDSHDTDEEGALTFAGDVDKFSLATIQAFSTYWGHRMMYDYVPVEAKEWVMLTSFIAYAHAEGIAYTDDEWQEIVDIMWDSFECNYVPTKKLNKFWVQLDQAYSNWYDREFPMPAEGEEDIPNRMKKEDMTKGTGGGHQVTYGTVFLIRQLQKDGFKGRLPTPSKIINFNPDVNDLF
jgi:hypothetical protein